MVHDEALPRRYVTVDVEEYFHIEAAHDVVPASQRGQWPSRVEANIERLLGVFADCRVRATFFFLAEVAQAHPGLVRRCVAAGHEIASHGMGHERLHRLTAEQFASLVRTSKQILEDQAGQAVRGFRAPTWSLTRATAWALDVLGEAGFAYDASIFPVYHPAYGISDAPAIPFYATSSGRGRALLELPPLTWRLGPRNLAVAGGGYFRLLPLGLMKRGLKQAATQGRPAILYFHPWEFDPEQPRMPLSWTGRMRTYTGLATAAARLRQVLSLPGTWRPLAADLSVLAAMAQRRGRFTLRCQPAA